MHLPDIAAILDAKKITQVSIIDDAYNKQPRLINVAADILEQLVAEVQASADLESSLLAADIVINSVDDLTEEIWNRLWTIEGSGTCRPLSEMLARLTLDRNEARSTLTNLERILTHDLKRRVKVFGTNEEIPDTAAKIIFVDFYLDEGGSKRESLALATRIGTRIKNLYAKELEKPLIILMSSRADITDEDREAFREAAQFIGGMFHFIWKNEFRDENRIRVWLYLVTATLEQGRVIQDCVGEFENAADRALTLLKHRMRGLSVDDFGYMQQLSLEAEGELLSEYVTACFSSFFVEQFRSNFLTDHEKIDDLTFDQLSIGNDSPSFEFVKLFMGIVSRPVGALLRHPKAAARLYKRKKALPTNVHFGDIFLKGKSVLMVATAECDLVCTPTNPTNRPFDPERQVLLIPGTIEPYSKPWKSLSGRTEYVEIDSAPRAIKWNFKLSRTTRLGGIKGELDLAGYSRVVRLGLEFALDVQRMYFNDIGRIGLPVGPPIYQPLSVALCAEGADGTLVTLFTDKDAESDLAVSFVTHNKALVQLTGAFLLMLPAAIEKAISMLQERKTNPAKRQKSLNRIAELSKIVLNEVLLSELRRPFERIEANKEQDSAALGAVMRMSSKARVDGPYSCERPLLLFLIPKPAEIVDAKVIVDATGQPQVEGNNVAKPKDAHEPPSRQTKKKSTPPSKKLKTREER